MTAVMKGVRVIEVAEHAFVPGAGALLSDWGAEVIKIEPAERGDASRALIAVGAAGINVLYQTANRGKKSIGLDLSKPEGREVLYKLVKKADVFLCNKPPRVRKKLKIDVEDIRAHNPKIIYVRGTGQGERGPDKDKGGYDLLTYWHRAGASSATASPRGELPFLPAPGFGDFTGAMFIAGGIMGALFHRERTGEAPIVDASLLATGMWAMGASGAVAASFGSYTWPPQIRSPLSAIYRTKDGRHIAFSCLQVGHYWPILCNLIERPDLAADARFKDHATVMENFVPAEQALEKVFAERPLDEWLKLLANFSGQWTVVQNVLQAVNDPQVLANDIIQDCRTANGQAYKLIAAPIQYDGKAATPGRGPEFNEHCEEILAGIGIDDEAMIDLKVRGIVA
jgi:crotonobetainyl-CoA:carnitine CoA-transferase CaiB-like acyl-CoA transferase